MEKAKGWKKLGELSQMFQCFRRMYVNREVEDDHPALLLWRRRLIEFLKGMLLSCEMLSPPEGGDCVRFRFEGSLSKVLGHSFCDWSSPDAFGCGLMSEMVQALLQVQSELPVSTMAIVHVLLRRMAGVHPGKETKGPFFALLSGLEHVLDACPAMPSAALGASIEECLRRPAPGSLGATRMFVGGVLSLASKSPRSLCRAVVSVLVRFVAERGCGVNDELLEAGETEEVRRCSPCVACLVATGVEADKRGRRPLRCNAQGKRDLVLEGVLRWAVDVHFRRCSSLLQASLSRAVCDGVRQALDSSELYPGGTTLPSFPLGCRLLLSFVGGLAGDGGAQVAALLQERCEAEINTFLARAQRFRSGTIRRAVGSKTVAPGTRVRRRPYLPVLDAYVGHLCLCRHLTDALAMRHLVWMARQALAVLRLLDGGQGDEASGTNTDLRRPDVEQLAALLASLTNALTLLLTRPRRGDVMSSTIILPESAGNLLEIIFDSDIRPLSSVPVPLAEAAVDVLKEAGHLQLTQSEGLLRPSPAWRSWGAQRESGLNGAGHGRLGDDAPVVREMASCVPNAASGDGALVYNGVEFVGANIAFESSWPLVAAGLDMQLPSLKIRKRGPEEGNRGGGSDADSDSGNSDDEPIVGNTWGRVPDEVTLRVFSFLTPKRVCRLSCVDRGWRELLTVPRVWRPFFEARWPVTVMQSDEDLAQVSERLLVQGQVLAREAKPKRRRVKTGVVRWEPSEAGQEPLLDWMELYRHRHRAEREARRRFATKTKFAWLVCPYLGCTCSLKSEFAVKRHIRTHKRRLVKGRVAKTNTSKTRATMKGRREHPAAVAAAAAAAGGGGGGDAGEPLP